MLDLFREAAILGRAYLGSADARAASTVGRLREVERFVVTHTGVELRNLRMLDIGPGQYLAQMTYFAALGNDVLGADSDVIVQGFDPRGYLRMFRSNGARRAVKTLARKALRFDVRFDVALRRELGIAGRRPRLSVLQMDATRIELGGESFDFVYSISVLQHVPDPGAAVSEIVRLLRPGGVAYVEFVNFTGPGGALCVSSMRGRDALPTWAHLRVAYEGAVRENAPLNRLRLDDWRALLQRRMPGCAISLDQPDRDELIEEARRLQENGELHGFAVEELVTKRVAVVWRKRPLEDGPTTTNA